MNDHRAIIVGVCEATRTFQSNPVVYTTYSRAKLFAPQERKILSYVLAKTEPGKKPEDIAEAIRRQTGLGAATSEQFIWKTMGYYFKYTGIPINFGITVALGFVVGAAIAGQTFYLFTIENLKQFGALKAMGVSNWRILGMSLVQATVVGVIGYALGVGGAVLFGVVMEAAAKTVPPAFLLTPHVMIGAAVAVFVIVFLSSLISIRKVLVLEPAVVFK